MTDAHLTRRELRRRREQQAAVQHPTIAEGWTRQPVVVPAAWTRPPAAQLTATETTAPGGARVATEAAVPAAPVPSAPVPSESNTSDGNATTAAHVPPKERPPGDGRSGRIVSAVGAAVSRVRRPRSVVATRPTPHGPVPEEHARHTAGREARLTTTRDVRTVGADLVVVLRDVVGLGSRGGRLRWARTVQVVVATAAVVTLVVGIRAIFAPVRAGSVPYAATFPQALAVASAERFTQSYFTWDEDEPDVRSNALAGVVQRGVSSQAGWDGKGRSTAEHVSAVGFTLVDADDALVTTVADVTSYERDGDGWTATGTETMALSVPVTVVGARTWVSGLPASVGVPEPSAAAGTATVEVDRALTAATKPAAAQYFAAIGRGDVRLTADGKQVAQGLDGVLTYRSLGTWRVVRSPDGTATGTATVRWLTPDGSELEQDYRVVLSDDEDDTWRVRLVTAAFPGGQDR